MTIAAYANLFGCTQITGIHLKLQIAEKIELMQHSVSILHGVEEYRDSVAQLSHLQTRLETMVAPFIEQAIANHNVST